MGYTRRQFIEDAFEEIGMGADQYDLQPSMLQGAMRRLNRMMAEWNGKGVRLGYPIPSNANGGDLDDETDVPDSAWEAIVTSLAIRIAPSYGKQVSPDTKAAAKRAYSTVLQRSTMPPEMQLGAIPAGAGNKPWRYNDNPFLPPPSDPIDVGPDGELEYS